ncbi:hypothetical protein ACX80E_06830 [Arthrobacter sp. TMN-49]
MSPAGPQQPEPMPGNRVRRAARRLRQLPGFTMAAVAFLVVVLLGGGGVAIAKWNQSATATIAITAGAAPAPSPTPGSQGNIVLSPVIAPRPATMDPDKVTCRADGNSGKYTVNWPANASSGISYVVSLSTSEKNYGSPQSKTVTVNTASFVLDNTQKAYGLYILRILPMKGGVAGDPVYRTVKHQKWSQQCAYASPEGRSPLGSFTLTAAPVPWPPAAQDNVLRINWTAAATATSYVVSVESKSTGSGGTTKKYGAEFTTVARNATLTFPPRVLDRWGSPAWAADSYGQYTLRIVPMNGSQAGDAEYWVVQYLAYGLDVWQE